MQVSEAMTRDVRLASPDETICDVARVMAECDIGSLPVGENDRLVGMITDRDIAVRAVAQGRSPETKVRDVMTGEVKYCFEDEDIDHVAQNLSDVQLHRLPVLDRDKRLVGIVALADIAKSEGPRPAGQAVCGISQPGGQHSGAGSSPQQHQSQSSQRQWDAGSAQASSSGQQQGEMGSSGRQSRSSPGQQQQSAGASSSSQQGGKSGPGQQQQQPSSPGQQQQQPSGPGQQHQQPSGPGQQQPGGGAPGQRQQTQSEPARGPSQPGSGSGQRQD